jgi:hypothetical protein
LNRVFVYVVFWVFDLGVFVVIVFVSFVRLLCYVSEVSGFLFIAFGVWVGVWLFCNAWFRGVGW